jgi:cation diffusion facilitator family transporter
MSNGSGSLKSIFYALGANLAIAIAKFVAAIVTGSGSMLAEAIHSIADCGNQGLLLFGIKQSKKPPSQAHPLGYGKNIYFWSFIVALMLFSMGGLFSIYEGIHKLAHSEPIHSPWIAIGVLIFAFCAEGLSLLGCLKEIKKDREERSLNQWFKETRKSELLVVFGEDLAALLGILFAFLAVSLTMLTGDAIFDAYGSIAIGCLLVVVAVFVGIEIKALLVGQGVEERDKLKMINTINAQRGVERVLNFVSLQLGNDVMVAVKVKMQDLGSCNEMIDRINEAEVAFKQAFPSVMWLFFEPDNKD